jgi:hypothetical protein
MLSDLAEASKPTFEIYTSTREISSRRYCLFAISKDFKIQPRYHFLRMVARPSHNSQSSADLAVITATFYLSINQTSGVIVTNANLKIGKPAKKGGKMLSFRVL